MYAIDSLVFWGQYKERAVRNYWNFFFLLLSNHLGHFLVQVRLFGPGTETNQVTGYPELSNKSANVYIYIYLVKYHWMSSLVLLFFSFLQLELVCRPIEYCQGQGFSLALLLKFSLRSLLLGFLRLKQQVLVSLSVSHWSIFGGQSEIFFFLLHLLAISCEVMVPAFYIPSHRREIIRWIKLRLRS